MNAKELRQAAESALVYTGLADSDIPFIGPKIDELARHILATVREDDDEPVNDEWFADVLGRPISQRCEFGWSYAVELNDADQWEVWLHECCLREIKTRGQFRSLCRGLGIELKEQP